MGQEIKKRIAADVIDTVYYSISVDSTTDVSHTDQLVFCLRYVKHGEIHERFIAFIPVEGHTSQYLFTVVSKFLDEIEIDIKNCRGQSYDNANNMAGIAGGLQFLIQEVNETAIFVPCHSHSLNLVGVNTVSKNNHASQFFDLLESVYKFFVNSPFRWNKLQEQLKEKDEYMLKRASGTRWSAKYNSVNAMHSCFQKMLNVLYSFTIEESFSDDNKERAKGLIRELCKFESIFMLFLWKSVLSKFNIVTNAFQKTNLTLLVIAKLYNSLILDLESKNYNNMFDEALAMFRGIPSNIIIDVKQTRSISRAPNPENESDKNFLKETLFDPVMNALLSNMKKRAEVYTDLDSRFSFVLKLNSMSEEEIALSCKDIASKYPKDLNEDQLINEF